jgi:dGTPase
MGLVLGGLLSGGSARAAIDLTMTSLTGAPGSVGVGRSFNLTNRAGILPVDRILAGRTERDLFLEHTRGAAGSQAEETLSELGDIAPADVKRPFEGSTAQRAALNMFGAQLITKYNTALSLAADGIHIDAHAKEEVSLLKTMMEWYVSRHSALVAQQYGQRAIIRKLFEVLFDAVQREAKFRDLIPLSYRDLLEKVDAQGLANNDDRRERARIVADIVSQMTEQEALSYYRRLTGSDSGSVRDQIIR